MPDILAGRELDTAIEERVFGNRVEPHPSYPPGYVALLVYDPSGRHIGGVAPYSTNIQEAWRIVEKLRERGYSACVTHAVGYPAWAQFAHGDDRWGPIAEAETPAEAISRAALKVVESDRLWEAR